MERIALARLKHIIKLDGEIVPSELYRLAVLFWSKLLEIKTVISIFFGG